MSVAADMVHEGARSIAGPLLAGLGAAALVGGVLAGALFEQSPGRLAAVFAAAQLASVNLLAVTLRMR